MQNNNDFQKQMYKKYSYNGYSSHFDGIYRGTGLASIILLGASALFSAKFFESYFIGLFGEYAIYAGFLVSALMAAGISVITERFLVYWHYQRLFEPLLGALLILLIAGNFYADYSGAPNWAEKIVGEAPADAKTAELAGIYTPQIDGINNEINAIESANFYWCGTHNKAHKCENSNFYIDPKRDRKHVEQIATLKAQKAELLGTMNGLLKSAGENFQNDLNDHNGQINANRGRMRFGSIVATTLFMLISFWRLKYGVSFVQTAGNETATVGNETATAQTQTETQNAKTPTVQTETPSVGLSQQAERAFSELVADNSALREELAARAEAERLGKQEPPF